MKVCERTACSAKFAARGTHRYCPKCIEFFSSEVVRLKAERVENALIAKKLGIPFKYLKSRLSALAGQFATREPAAKVASEPEPIRTPKVDYGTMRRSTLPAAPKPTFAPMPSVLVRERQWPLGDPRSLDFHFCCDVPLPGKSYCDEHYATAHQRIRVAETADAA